MSIMSRLAGGLDKAVARRAKALENEMLLFCAIDEGDYYVRLKRIEAQRLDHFSFFA